MNSYTYKFQVDNNDDVFEVDSLADALAKLSENGCINAKTDFPINIGRHIIKTFKICHEDCVGKTIEEVKKELDSMVEAYRTQFNG